MSVKKTPCARRFQARALENLQFHHLHSVHRAGVPALSEVFGLRTKSQPKE
jgi:hypothetical protein